MHWYEFWQYEAVKEFQGDEVKHRAYWQGAYDALSLFEEASVNSGIKTDVESSIAETRRLIKEM